MKSPIIQARLLEIANLTVDVAFRAGNNRVISAKDAAEISKLSNINSKAVALI